MILVLSGFFLVVHVSTVFAEKELWAETNLGEFDYLSNLDPNHDTWAEIDSKIAAREKIYRRSRRQSQIARPKFEKLAAGTLTRTSSNVTLCPEKCKCRTAPHEVYCVFKFLTKIPRVIPEGVEKINLGLNEIVDVPFHSFANYSDTLLYVFLHSNGIRSLGNGVFSSLNKLKVLRLSWNKLAGIRKTTFYGLHNVERLYLDNNRLSFIHPLAFRGLSNLQFLQLDGNKLSRVHQDIFVTVEFEKYFKLSTLQYLFLTKNSFTHLPRRVFDHMHALRSVYLHDNPWECSCETKWLKKWMGRENKDRCRKNSWRLKSPSQCAVCDWPSSLRGRKIDNVSSTEFKCERPLVGENATKRNEFDWEEMYLQSQVALFRYSGFYSTRVNLRLDSYRRSMLHATCNLTGIPAAKVAEIERNNEGNRMFSASFEGQMRCFPEYPTNPVVLRDLLEPYLDRQINLTLQNLKLVNLNENTRVYAIQVEKFADRPSSPLTAASISSDSSFMLSKSSTILIHREGVGVEENIFYLTFRTSFAHTHVPKPASEAAKDPWVLIRQPHPSSVDVVTAMERKTVNFKCKTVGQPKPKITWISPSEEVIHTGVRGVKYAVSRSGRLYIRKPAPGDSGFYRCIATVPDSKGSRSTAAVEIATMKLEVFPRTKGKSEAAESALVENVAEGEEWTSKCDIEGLSKATIGWITPDDQMIVGEGKGRHGRISINENGTITIPGFQKADQGLYRCVAASIAGREEYSVVASVSGEEDEALIEEIVIMDFDSEYDEPEAPDLSLSSDQDHIMESSPTESPEIENSNPTALETLDVDSPHDEIFEYEDPETPKEMNNTESSELEIEPELKPHPEIKPEPAPQPEFNLEPEVKLDLKPELGDLDSYSSTPNSSQTLLEIAEATAESRIASASDDTSSSPEEQDIPETPIPEILEETSPKYFNFLATPTGMDKKTIEVRTGYRTHRPQEIISYSTSPPDIATETHNAAITDSPTQRQTSTTITNPPMQPQTDSDESVMNPAVLPTVPDTQTLFNHSDREDAGGLDSKTDEHADLKPTQASGFQNELDPNQFLSLKGRPDGTLDTSTLKHTDTELDTNEDNDATDKRSDQSSLGTGLQNIPGQTDTSSTGSDDIDAEISLLDKLPDVPTSTDSTRKSKSFDEMMAESDHASLSANNKIISAIVKMPGSDGSKSLPDMTSPKSPRTEVTDSRPTSSGRHRTNSRPEVTTPSRNHVNSRRRTTSLNGRRTSSRHTNSRKGIEVPARRIGFVESPAMKIETIHHHSINGQARRPDGDTVYGQENQRIALPCLPIGGYFAPRAWTFTWRLPSGEKYNRPNRIFSRDWSKFVHSNGSLLLRSLKAKDEGVYSCVAIDELQSNEYHFEVKLVISSRRPRIHNAAREYMRLEAADPLFLPCMVTGNPQPQTHWETPWGTKIYFGRIRGRIEVFENGTLYTPDVLPEQRGSYRCIARNSVGFAARMVTVAVMTHPPRFIDPTHRTERVKRGETISLSCAATGFPKPKFYWILPNGDKIYSNQAIFTSGYRNQAKQAVMDKGTLIVARAEQKDFGRYHCVIANYLGRAASTVLLLVTR